MDKKQNNVLTRLSKEMKAALDAVKNMRDVQREPLPGRTPSKTFLAALGVLKSLGKKK